MRAILMLTFAAASLPAQAPPATVSVVRVELREFSPTVVAVGQTAPSRTARVSAEIQARVTGVAVDAGSRVDTRKVVVTLDKQRLLIARRQAEAELELEKQKLAELDAGSRPDDVLAAKAALAAAEALLREAQREHQREKDLATRGSSSAENLSKAQATEESALAVRDEKKARLDLVVTWPREELKAQQRAQVLIKQAALDRVIDDLERTDVRSPIPGIVTERHADPGHVVMPGAILLEIARIDPVRVVVPASERIVGLLQTGVTVPVTFDALPGESFTGSVEAVVPEGDDVARTFPARLLVGNEDGRLLPGMLARAALPSRRPARRLAVPRDAVLSQPGRFVVWKVKDGRAQVVEVRPADEQDGWIAVDGDLSAGDRVVTAGNARLRLNQPVTIVPQQRTKR